MPSRARGLRGNFYPRPPRGGRQRLHRQRAGGSAISIHALREEGDGLFTVPYEAVKIFLSTPSARRATRRSARGWSACINFYPRPPRGGRHGRRRRPHDGNGISIHALREEGDTVSADSVDLGEKFLSTPSARRATCGMPYGTQPETISIHALREEGDRMPSTSFSRSSDFYPRPPRGGRRGLPPRCCCRA